MLTLMERAGDSAINDLWHSVVQLVTNHPQLHAYAARRSVEALRRGASYAVFVKCTGYLLGEYGPGLAAAGEVPLMEQLGLLQERFVAATPETKVGVAGGGWPVGDGCRAVVGWWRLAGWVALEVAGWVWCVYALVALGPDRLVAHGGCVCQPLCLRCSAAAEAAPSDER
jgi:hypothetical protein